MPKPTPALTVTVSVVIPAHNAEAFLGDCLRSVLSQEGGRVSDVIVVDDGSADRTSEVARAHLGVRVIRLEVNQGPSAARNAGMAAAHGQFVAFLDADDLWPPGSLAARLKALERHAEAALVFGDCRQFDQRGPRERTQFETGSLGLPAWGDSGVVPGAYGLLLQDNFITTGSVLARRAVVLQTGGFAEDLRLVEDLDLWLRIARRHGIAWCSNVCLLRRRHETNSSRDAVAMSLAYLEVLRRQSAQTPRLDKKLQKSISDLAAREQLQLADVALQSHRPNEALRWAFRSLLARITLRTLQRVGRALLGLLRQSMPPAHRR